MAHAAAQADRVPIGERAVLDADRAARLATTRPFTACSSDVLPLSAAAQQYDGLALLDLQVDAAQDFASAQGTEKVEYFEQGGRAQSFYGTRSLG